MIPSLSIIMPAYNEEGNLEAAVQGILAILEKSVPNFELLIINDASTDRTGEIAEKLAQGNSRVRVFHHDQNKGFGASYRTGLGNAQYNYVCHIPADNEIVPESMAELFRATGTADVLITYGARENVRPWVRRTISKLWTYFLNLLFGFRLKYYNGPCVYQRAMLLNMPLQTDSFAFQTVNLIQSLQQGASTREIVFHLQPRGYGHSKIFRLKNIVGSLQAVLKLFWETRLSRILPTLLLTAAGLFLL